jgi:DNA-binding NarL/FixJ family response regulator
VGKIRILLCDRQPLMRSGLRLIIEQQPEMFVLGEADGPTDLVPMTMRIQPDVVVMDVDLPQERGVRVIRRLTQSQDQRPSVLVLTGVAEPRTAFAALRAGARGFLLKGCPPRELFDGIQAVACGGGVITPVVAGVLLSRIAPFLPASIEDDNAVIQDSLTDREQEILRMVASGCSNSEVARTLGISKATVRSHVHHVLAKLNLVDRTQAVAYAYRTGFVSPFE